MALDPEARRFFAVRQGNLADILRGRKISAQLGNVEGLRAALGNFQIPQAPRPIPTPYGISYNPTTIRSRLVQEPARDVLRQRWEWQRVPGGGARPVLKGAGRAQIAQILAAEQPISVAGSGPAIPMQPSYDDMLQMAKQQAAQSARGAPTVQIPTSTIPRTPTLSTAPIYESTFGQQLGQAIKPTTGARIIEGSGGLLGATPQIADSKGILGKSKAIGRGAIGSLGPILAAEMIQSTANPYLNPQQQQTLGGFTQGAQLGAVAGAPGALTVGAGVGIGNAISQTDAGNEWINALRGGYADESSFLGQVANKATWTSPLRWIMSGAEKIRGEGVGRTDESFMDMANRLMGNEEKPLTPEEQRAKDPAYRLEQIMGEVGLDPTLSKRALRDYNLLVKLSDGSEESKKQAFDVIASQLPGMLDEQDARQQASQDMMLQQMLARRVIEPYAQNLTTNAQAYSDTMNQLIPQLPGPIQPIMQLQNQQQMQQATRMADAYRNQANTLPYITPFAQYEQQIRNLAQQQFQQAMAGGGVSNDPLAGLSL